MAKKRDPAIDAHLEWLGFVRPTGLVVSAPALVRAGAILNTHDREGQERLASCVLEREKAAGTVPVAPDFREFAKAVLGWSFSPKGFAGTDERPIPDELKAHLPDFGETLAPDLAVLERSPGDDETPWQLLVRILNTDTDLDTQESVAGSTLDASPHGRMERLLRQTGVHAGLLFNGSTLRLVSAPRGESSGWLDFRVEEMLQTAGRPICAAMRLLLHERRLLSLPKEERLSALLLDSRKFQNEVSEQLAEQVMHALYELVRGLQAAHDQSKGELLREVLRDKPDEVYRGLLTVLLRIVFLLYAEEREMLASDDVFMQYYSIAGLHERLREDAAHYPDTLDQRYGAWAQLLGLFRMVYDGAELGPTRLPRRHGVLFDPNRFPFLEGRGEAGARQVGERLDPPMVPDGTVYRVLQRLLILDGERISYRALDVEQIGSVYETMMGFRLETAKGRSLAIKSKGRGGAPTTVNLDKLLEVQPGKRRKWLQDRTERKVSTSVNRDLKDATTLEEIHAALRPVSDRRATPDLVPPGAIVLQPSEERRKSGSHYTPRTLTEPIVRKTLEPILTRLAAESDGETTPEQILELKICDPAMGSGAFLVEVCRQLGDALLDAWKAGDGVPPLPPDEDEVVFARRRVAQRCLYGVDRNPVAVDLAKVSLWLVTLAKDHAFTFLDHALRHGDSLVGLSRRQIELFHWDTKSPSGTIGIETERVRDHVDRALKLRRQIRNAGEAVEDWELRALWRDAEAELGQVRLFGDLVVAAYFQGSKKKEREGNRATYAGGVASGNADSYGGHLLALRVEDPPLVPFHWEVEFPEVFDREKGGFDALVGNPPFMGGTIISTKLGASYRDWLHFAFPKARGRCDLVAFFFRRAFQLGRNDGALGLIATNTVAQGDTRTGGLRWICEHGGEIYHAQTRVRWPGSAAVVVSAVHVWKGPFKGTAQLDGRSVDKITAFLFSTGGSEDPARLASNTRKCFVGSYVLGMGFTFDDTDSKGVANPLSEMRRLIAAEPTNSEVIFPYIGGEEVNSSPTQQHHRYVINFGERDERECRERWPELMQILETRVKPDRLAKATEVATAPWWLHWRSRADLYAAIADLTRVLVVARVARAAAFTFLPPDVVYSDQLVVFPFSTFAAFSGLQARTHDVWARFFRVVYERRPPVHAIGCLRYVPLPHQLDRAYRSQYPRSDVLRVPHRDHARERRGANEDLQPLP